MTVLIPRVSNNPDLLNNLNLIHYGFFSISEMDQDSCCDGVILPNANLYLILTVQVLLLQPNQQLQARVKTEFLQPPHADISALGTRTVVSQCESMLQELQSQGWILPTVT